MAERLIADVPWAIGVALLVQAALFWHLVAFGSGFDAATGGPVRDRA